MGYSQTRSVAKFEQNTPNGIYITFENSKLDFVWKAEEVKKVMLLWFNGYSIKSIAKRAERHISEVALLVFDLAEEGYLKPRANGIKWN